MTTGEKIFHSPTCKCGHKKTLHAGADSDGRCVNRACGCGRFNPVQAVIPEQPEREWTAAEAGAAVAAALDQLGTGPWSPPDYPPTS